MPHSKPSFLRYKQAFKIATGYIFFGFIWILFSDQMVELLFNDSEMLRRAQTLKGSFFVAITGLFLYLFLLVQFRAINEANRALSVINAKLKERNVFIDQIYNGINGIIMVWSLDGKVIEINRYFSELSGYDADEIVGQYWYQLFLPPEDQAIFQLTTGALVKTGEINNYENDILIKSGQTRRILWNDRIIQNDGMDMPIVISFGVDLSDSVEKDMEINRLLYFDKVTTAPNAIKFELDCRSKLLTKTPFTIIFVSVNSFRKINSQFGVLTGDSLLIRVYNYLCGCFQKESIYRWNDGTFVIHIPEINREILRSDLNLLLSGFSEHQVISGKELVTGLNIGLIQYPINCVTFENLIQYVTYANVTAENTGQHNYRFFTEQMLEELNQSIEAETKLKEALEQDKLELFLQPLYNMTLETVDAVEVLLRCLAEDFYFQSIQDFIKIAERTGQIVDVDFWVIRKAFELCASNELLASLDVGINLSAQTFTSSRFIPFIESLVKEYPNQAKKVVFELTEHTVVDDFDEAANLIEALRQFGFNIALDDFGSEYSSLKYISKLNFDTIKIDKTFIDTLLESEIDREIVDGIIRLGERIQVKIVAEGVETLEQMKQLRDMGCHYVQGYLISKPQRISAILDYLAFNHMDTFNA